MSTQLATLLRELADDVDTNALPAWLVSKLRDTVALASQWKRRSNGILCNTCLRGGTYTRFDDLQALNAHVRSAHNVTLAGLPLTCEGGDDDGGVYKGTIRLRSDG